MPRCVAFLRAVNVGGRMVKMDALKAEFEALGLARVGTFIASGNVVFDSKLRQHAALERKIEARLHAVFGFEVHTFVRTADEVAAIAAHAAFDAAEVAAARTHVVGFLASSPDAAALEAIAGLESDVDRFHVHGRELYWLSRLGQSESTFSNALFEKKLGMRTTFRGLNTLHKLLAKYPPGP